MVNIISHNLVAMNTQRQLGLHSKSKIKSTEKLSSGYKINRAADDAAGLSISEKMRRQIRGLRQASKNIQDGISFVQVADGALNEVHDILHRMNELSVKAANGTNTTEDRIYIQQELIQLSQECDRIFKTTEFNSEKIWQAPYIPYVTGIPRELKIYNETIDSNGNITFGGIIWGNNRYSWDEIDANMFIAGTDEFNPGTYHIDVPAVAFDISKDEYVENGNTVTLTLTVSEEGHLTSISRECGWSADGSGITMDGVLYKWTDLENSNHNKLFNPNSIEPGNWGINTYNGTHVWFEIPEGTTDLSEVISGINGTLLDNLSWTTQISYVQTNFAVGILYGADAAIFDAPTIRVTNATKDLVSDKYYLHADETGVWVNNESDIDLGTETWEELGWENSLGEFLPAHNATNHIYYEYPILLDQPDNHAAVVGGDWHYTSGDEGYNSILIPGLDIQFMLLEEASKQGVINGIEGVIIDAKIKTPSQAEITGAYSSGKVTIGRASASLSFNFHNIMGRDFENEYASLGSGRMVKDSNGMVSLDIANAASFNIQDSYTDIENKVKKLLSGNGGTLSLKFENTSGDVVELNYQIDALTLDEKQSIIDGTDTVDAYSNAVLSDIFAGMVELKANGYAEQSLGYDRSSMSAIGWANPQNNKAAYADFNTKITYTRELNIQAGTEAGQHIKIQYDVLNASILGIGNISVHDEFASRAGINSIKKALEVVSEQRSVFGAYQNRLEHAVQINDNTAENTADAESLIRDADMAIEIIKNSIQNILMQAGQAMLVQANQNGSSVLSLLE